MQAIPCLWFLERVEEAVAFYVGLLPDSRIDQVTLVPGDPDGAVRIVEFTLAGSPYMAFQAPGADPFNHAVSISVECETQAEIDRVWEALLQGGAPEQCGWLRDRFGVSWQIVPRALPAMYRDPDRQRAGRAMQAMLGMVKLDIAALQRAFDGA